MKKFNEIREENEKTANKLQEESKEPKTNWIWDSNSAVFWYLPSRTEMRGSYKSPVALESSAREVTSFTNQPMKGELRDTPILETQTLGDDASNRASYSIGQTVFQTQFSQRQRLRQQVPVMPAWAPNGEV